MALLSGLFSLFGCNTKAKQNSKTTNFDTTIVNIYPTDHKLTSQERKDLTNAFLKQKGVPILESLPLVEDYKIAKFRDTKEIASKAVVLYGLIYVANKAKTSEEITGFFKKYNLWKYVSPNERTYLAKPNKTDKDNNPMTWRVENLNTLLWALNHFEKLAYPTEMCDFRNYKNLPSVENDPTEWINNSKLRETEDILNETDLNYRLHWATEDARVNNTKTPANLNTDVLLERHFALNWLTMYSEDWDDITTDT
jgi:hypothetical protein